jgi:hypothetical protein
MVTLARFIAVLKLATVISLLIKQGKAIVQAMTNNIWFTTPSPALAAVSALLDALEGAEVLARSKAPGAVKARNAQLVLVVAALRALQAYVQSIADANLPHAEAIILSAGMFVKKVTPRQKNTFKATQGSVSGLVLLVAAHAAIKASYVWQWSLDMKSWTTLPQTMVAKTELSGLTPATVYYFRYRAVTKAGEGDWSQIISLLVK